MPIVLCLVLQSVPTHVNEVAGYSAIAPKNILVMFYSQRFLEVVCNCRINKSKNSLTVATFLRANNMHLSYLSSLENFKKVLLMAT